MGQVVPFKTRTQRGVVRRQAIISVNTSGESEEKVDQHIQVALQLVSMWAYIRSLNVLISNEKLALRREGLTDFTLAQLEQIALKSTESKWKTHPHYYIALMDEIKSRRAKLQK